jgi:UDP-N-acetylmuramoyl-tripeptide--D-alanyl-D-alanine ligase
MQMDKLYEVFRRSRKVQTDTRKLQAGEIFFALRGPNFNGNRYAAQALERGAAAVVIDEPIEHIGERVFLVEDALKALQELARYHRQQLNIPFIAITGSNGKTTTKELVHTVLSSHFKTATTQGNLNNHIGVPLTILSIPDDAEMAVIEMGANHQQEIAGYCQIAFPTHGMITNCGKAHMEGFGGEEGIRKGKGELYDFLRGNNGTVFVNSAMSDLMNMSKGLSNQIYYGSPKGSFNADIVQSDPLLTIEINRLDWGLHHLHTNLVGSYNLANVEAAICIGDHFGIPFIKIAQAIATYVPNNARSQLLNRGSNTLFLDAYNANPSSMKVAIENFARQHHPNKWLMLGAMMELGDASVAEHQQLIELLESLELTQVVLVGGDFEHTKHHFHYFRNTADAAVWISVNKPESALILIKGSRSIGMEKLVEML